MTKPQIKDAIEYLSRTTSGMAALDALRALATGPSLDSRQQNAVAALLASLHGPLCGTTREILRESVSS